MDPRWPCFPIRDQGQWYLSLVVIGLRQSVPAKRSPSCETWFPTDAQVTQQVTLTEVTSWWICKEYHCCQTSGLLIQRSVTYAAPFHALLLWLSGLFFFSQVTHPGPPCLGPGCFQVRKTLRPSNAAFGFSFSCVAQLVDVRSMAFSHC